MRKPKGKLVALLAGAVVVVLLAMLWGDIYCHLFLDPRLVGRWERTAPIAPSVFLEFDKVGNMKLEKEWRVRGRYRVDGKRLTLFSDGKPVWEDHFVVALTVDLDSYRIVGDTLTLLDSPGPETYRRVPDDS